MQVTTMKHNTSPLKEQTPTCTVLAIEDNEFFARVYHAVFTSLGCRLIRVGTVAQALEVLNKEKPNLVIVDIRLPDGSGLSVIKAVREREAHRETPVITITTRSSEDEERAIREAGTTVFLPKPVNVNELKTVALRYIGTGS
jgi:DNA-binding response OmpR family regulator